MATPEARSVHNTRRWRSLRAAFLRAHPLCALCSRPTPATEVDHIVAIRDGGAPWSWDNLQALCKPCHSRKTGAGERVRGCTVDGAPLDQTHWWNSPAEKSLRADGVDRDGHPHTELISWEGF